MAGTFLLASTLIRVSIGRGLGQLRVLRLDRLGVEEHVGTYGNCPQPMKKQILTIVGLVLVWAACTLTISLVSARSKVSLTMVEYRSWPHGAVLRIANDSRAIIRYLAEPNNTPAGGPVLCQEKTSTGWTNRSTTVKALTVFNPGTKKFTEAFTLVDPGYKAGDRMESLLNRELRPGQNVVFFVRLEPGASPKRIGTVWYVPQSEFLRKVQTWLSPIRQWCGIKPTPPDQLEVWCPESLQMASPTQAPLEN